MTEPSVQLDFESGTMELYADGPQTAGFVTGPFLTVTEDSFILSVGPTRSVNPVLNRALEFFTYLITYLRV